MNKPMSQMHDRSDENAEDMRLIIRCCLRAFNKYLNTTETRTIKRAAKRMGIKI